MMHIINIKTSPFIQFGSKCIHIILHIFRFIYDSKLKSFLYACTRIVDNSNKESARKLMLWHIFNVSISDMFDWNSLDWDCNYLLSLCSRSFSLMRMKTEIDNDISYGPRDNILVFLHWLLVNERSQISSRVEFVNFLVGSLRIDIIQNGKDAILFINCIH